MVNTVTVKLAKVYKTGVLDKQLPKLQLLEAGRTQSKFD